MPEESRAGPVLRGIGSSRLAATAWLLCCSYLSFHWDKPGSGTLWALDLGFTGGSLSKESTCSTEDAGDVGSIPGSGRSPRGGNGNPLQHSCLENPMGRGPRWVIVHGVAKSQTQLRDLAHAHRMDISLPSPLLASSRADAVTQKRTG